MGLFTSGNSWGSGGSKGWKLAETQTAEARAARARAAASKREAKQQTEFARRKAEAKKNGKGR